MKKSREVLMKMESREGGEVQGSAVQEVLIEKSREVLMKKSKEVLMEMNRKVLKRKFR